jgi:hypothetical protein
MTEHTTHFEKKRSETGLARAIDHLTACWSVRQAENRI